MSYQILPFFNTPPQISDAAMREVFMEEDVTPPKAMKLFQSKTDRSSSGLLEFDSVSEALEALVCCNHARIPNPCEFAGFEGANGCPSVQISGCPSVRMLVRETH